tara:strand:- start:118 stop:1113 length:996 start_codon:yes stop_codon:yes gene_type:complete
MDNKINPIIFETKKHENVFIYEKELRALMHNLKKKAYENNGILYGDIVINSIISKYYKEKFMENKNIGNDFWNTDIDPDTSGRTITSKNFDVYFKNFTEYLHFLNNIKSEKNYEIINTSYINSDNFIHNKYILNINIGKTITWEGINISLNLNITSRIPKEKYIEPPFNAAYFSSDLLIMTKDGNGPRFSRNTGIIELDNMNIIDKNEIFAKIIKEICFFKLNIVSRNNLANNHIAYKSIEYIENGWTITNLPFKIENYENEEKSICCICLDEINKETNVGKLINSKCLLHIKCLLEYLKNKLNENDELVCPFRQEINFANNNFINTYLIK